MLSEAYADFAPEDLPVDLQRLNRDLAIARDQRVADAAHDIETAYDIAVDVIGSVAQSHPALYHAEPKARPVGANPIGAPSKIAKALTTEQMRSIATQISGSGDGASVVSVCEMLGFDSPRQHLAAKHFLAWLRKEGYATTVGVGKGMKYAATKRTKMLVDKLLDSQDSQPGQ